MFIIRRALSLVLDLKSCTPPLTSNAALDLHEVPQTHYPGLRKYLKHATHASECPERLKLHFMDKALQPPQPEIPCDVRIKGAECKASSGVF